jgi:hypothetical protein
MQPWCLLLYSKTKDLVGYVRYLKEKRPEVFATLFGA